MSPERLVNYGEVAWGEAGADHMARYLFAAGYCRGKLVLDVGTGRGYGAALLMTSGAASVDAFDIDPQSVAAAQEEFGHAGVEFFEGDSETFDELGRKYDLICSFENIEHIQSPEKFVRAARRSLAPSGVLLCSTPARERDPEWVNGRPNNPFHQTEWFRDEFEALMRTEFEQVEMYAQVESFSLIQRRQAVDALIGIVRNPLRAGFVENGIRGALRISDAVGLRSLRKAAGFYGDISGLACPSPGDFPLVHAALSRLFGQLFAHCAVCHL